MRVAAPGEACALVGDCFNHGHGVDRDEPLAFYWFMRGALGGDGACCARVSEIFQDESSPRFNMEMAIFWLSEGHRRGSSDVKYELGRRLTFGEGPWVKYRNPQAGARLLSVLPLKGDSAIIISIQTAGRSAARRREGHSSRPGARVPRARDGRAGAPRTPHPKP